MLVVIPLSAMQRLRRSRRFSGGTCPHWVARVQRGERHPYELIAELAMPAFLIALIGFVESISVGKTLGAKKRQRIDANQELIGLGAANTAAALSGGFPVTGGFSRSVVNFDAGADTQMASILTALGIALAAMFLAPLLFHLPKAVLAATIIVAVLSLVNVKILRQARRFSAADFASVSSDDIGDAGGGCGAGGTDRGRSFDRFAPLPNQLPALCRRRDGSLTQSTTATSNATKSSRTRIFCLSESMSRCTLPTPRTSRTSYLKRPA